MSIRRRVLYLLTSLTIPFLWACGAGSYGMPTPPAAPTPTPAPPGVTTANAYILPGAEKLGPLAFGEPPLVAYTGERLNWINSDTTVHALVADAPGATDFVETGTLTPGAERAVTMTRIGTTKFHCTIHPGMVGTLVVRDR